MDDNNNNNPAFDALDEETQHAIVRAVGDGLAPTTLEPIERSLMRARLLSRVRDAGEDRQAVTIAKDDGAWQPFSPRIQIKVLRHDESSTSYLLKLDAGAMIWPHKHAQDEECVVLEGCVTIGNNEMHVGTFHLAPRGKNHEPIRSTQGATLYLRGAKPSIRDLAPVDAIKAWWRGS